MRRGGKSKSTLERRQSQKTFQLLNVGTWKSFLRAQICVRNKYAKRHIISLGWATMIIYPIMSQALENPKVSSS